VKWHIKRANVFKRKRLSFNMLFISIKIIYRGYFMEKVNKLWEQILERNIVSEETLRIVTDINGYNIETLNDVIYAATGYRSLEQFDN